MLHTYKESDILMARSAMLNHEGSFPKDQTYGLRPEIQESWKRCKAVEMDPKVRAIDTPPVISEHQKRPDEISDLLSEMLKKELLDSFYSALCGFDAAILCAHSDSQIIYFQAGSERMLQYLSKCNIKPGSSLAEAYLGTTAASFIHSPGNEATVIGYEHYLNILAPFATWCYFSADYGSTYNLVIFPKERISFQLITYLETFFKARKYKIEDYKKTLELELKNKTSDLLMQYQDQAIIFLDSLGRILNANEHFCNWFRVDLPTVKYKKCSELLPDLDRAISCLDTGERIYYEEVHFKDMPVPKQFMRMDVIPTQEGGKVTGLIITLSNCKKVRQTVHRVTNSSAYYTFEDILGESTAMVKCKRQASQAALSDSTVVLCGESGTGKELFAQAIHNASPRKECPFVALNCGAMPQELILSELFGYVEGSFTGARKGGAMGKIEHSHHGTLFLDEIGEMPLHAQTILLRVLEERVVTRIGSNTPMNIDIRLICATNRSLIKMVQEGTFRHDLYYRLNVVQIIIPPLRERISDIPLLVNHFIEYFNHFLGDGVRRISPEAMQYLAGQHFGGNIRELRNVIECAMHNVTGDVLLLEHLPTESFNSNVRPDKQDAGAADARYSTEFDKMEKNKLLALMMEHNGNKSLVAKSLGVSRSTLYRKLKSHYII